MQLSDINKRLLRIVLRGSYHNSFGRVLLAPIKAIKAIPRGLAYEYKVPPSLCRIQQHKPVLSNAATMAIFDELSSDAMMVVDKGHRGGISVHLTTELIRPARLNEEVVVVTTIDKTGRTLGYLTMELRNTQGELLARGKHIKYMSMGWYYNTVCHPRMLPFSLKFYDLFMGRNFTTEMDNIVTQPRHVPDLFEGVGSVFDSLSLQKVDILPTKDGPERVYKILVRSTMTNQLGMFHGGCAAVAIEEACESYLNEFRADNNLKQDTKHGEEAKLYAERMEVRYLATMKGELEIHVSRVPAPFHSNEVVFKGRIIMPRTGQVGIEFTCSCTRG